MRACGDTRTPSVATTLPSTFTHPFSIHSSASRREQSPSSLIRFERRGSSGFSRRAVDDLPDVAAGALLECASDRRRSCGGSALDSGAGRACATNGRFTPTANSGFGRSGPPRGADAPLPVRRRRDGSAHGCLPVPESCVADAARSRPPPAGLSRAPFEGAALARGRSTGSAVGTRGAAEAIAATGATIAGFGCGLPRCASRARVVSGFGGAAGSTGLVILRVGRVDMDW